MSWQCEWVELAREAQSRVAPATIVYGTGRCDLAAHRDYFDVERKRYVCGFNPTGPADRHAIAGQSLRCCRDALWRSSSITPVTPRPWPGTTRCSVPTGSVRCAKSSNRRKVDAACFCKEHPATSGRAKASSAIRLWPIATADKWDTPRFPTLATLPPPGTEYRYAGPVISGTAIGTWWHEHAL